MKHYRAICFDFDYTLGDSTDSIVGGFQYAFGRMGLPIPDRDTVRGTVGYLLEDAYQMLTGDSDKEHRAQFRAYFLEVARPRQVEETPCFPARRSCARPPQPGRAPWHRKHQDGRDHLPHYGALWSAGHPGDHSGQLRRHPPQAPPGGHFEGSGSDGCGSGGVALLRRYHSGRPGCPGSGVDFAAVLNGTTQAPAFAPYPCVHIAPDLAELAQWLEGRA